MGTTFDVPMDMSLSLALAHHGIKGQKWGVRHFQNDDGSLTEAGRKRYLKSLRDGIHAVKNVEDLPDSQAKQAFKDAADEAATAYRDYFDKRHALATAYWDNRDAVKKYSTKLAENTWDDAKKILGWKDSQKSEWINSHLNGDFDQGDSFDLWLKDQGGEYKSLMELSKKHIDAANRAEALGAEYVRSMLGQYADMPVNQAVKLKMKTPQDTIRRNEYKRTTLAKAIPSYYVFEREMSHSDFLMHHGIKGQKWGVRRFQNPDGTLTAAGRARYDVGGALKSLANNVSEHRRDRFEKKKEKIVAKGNAKQVSRISSKLTTKELEDAIRRVELTQKINELRVKPTTYKFVGTITNVMRNTSTLGNSFADAADAVKRVKKLFNKVDEEAEARKKGRLAGIEEGEKLKAKNEIFPDAKRVKLKDIRGFTRTDNLNDRINSMSDKDTSDITKLARSSKVARLNERIWNLPDADRDQRSPSNPNRNTDSYWTQGSPRNSTSYWYTPKVSRDKKPPTVSSAVQSKTTLNMRNPINLSLSLTKAGINLKQLREDRKKTKDQSKSSTAGIGSLNDSLLSANQKKLDEYEKKKKK